MGKTADPTWPVLWISGREAAAGRQRTDSALRCRDDNVEQGGQSRPVERRPARCRSETTVSRPWLGNAPKKPLPVRLVPQPELRAAIERDHRAMRDMILGDAPSLDHGAAEIRGDRDKSFAPPSAGIFPLRREKRSAGRRFDLVRSHGLSRDLATLSFAHQPARLLAVGRAARRRGSERPRLRPWIGRRQSRCPAFPDFAGQRYPRQIQKLDVRSAR